MRENNVVQQKSFQFALKSIRLYQLLKDKNEFAISKQLLKSGTSVGANIEEALGAQSTRDFLAKISIAYKEARETHYWLKLLVESKMLELNQIDDTLDRCDELLRLIGSIQKTLKKKIRNS